MSDTLNVADLAGPQLLGKFINWGLIGVLSVQVYLYHTLFPKDRLALRLFVYALLAVEWVQTGLITADAFGAFVYHFGDVPYMLMFRNSWFSVPVMCGVVSVAVQLFYARRIFVLSGSTILTGAVCLMALVQGSAAIAGGIEFKIIKTATREASTKPTNTTWLAVSAATDILIAVAMTILLLRAKTSFRRSDTVINKLVRLTIESGAITASVAIITVTLFAVVPKALYHECPGQWLAKLYVNMMVASLNNRALIRQNDMRSTGQTSLGIPSTLSCVTGSANTGSRNLTEMETIVHIDVMQESISQGDYSLTDIQKGSITSMA